MTSCAAERAERALLSLCAADALGGPTEFMSPGEITRAYGYQFRDYREGSVFDLAPGEATDDSQMTVAILLAYTAGGGVRRMRDAFLEWYDAGPPDVGVLTSEALTSPKLHGGALAWLDGRCRSAGNGGLMRVAAVWIAGFEGAALARESALVTGLTHVDPRCVHASVCLTAALERLGEGAPYVDAFRHGLDVMRRATPFEWLRDAGLLDDQAGKAFRERDLLGRDLVKERVVSGLQGRVTSQSGFVLDTLEAAVARASGRDWLGCVEPAVLAGDDSDTVACIVGAIIGARGLAVPEHLLDGRLRIGHSWMGWDRRWPLIERAGALVASARSGRDLAA